MPTTSTQLEELKLLKDNHNFWENSLLRAAQAGSLTLHDYRYIWGQYYLYSQNFTRYVAGVLAACEDDYYRACLSENLWEEGGGCKPGLRHSEIFRQFLRRLDIDPLNIKYADFTKLFFHQYLSETIRADVVWSTAILSLGTESIVSRMYKIFVQGMLRAGIPEPWLHFFHLHIECDDQHAATLEELLCSLSTEPGWYERCAAALDKALTLRTHFFENLHMACLQQRLHPMLERIEAGKSLPSQFSLLFKWQNTNNELLYSNQNQQLGIEFVVERLPFQGDVLDPRVIQIPVGKSNERHRHAHETLFYIIQGQAQIQIDRSILDAGPGDCVFVPRWVIHQSRNVGQEALIILAVTDFGLTSSYLGNYERQTRMKKVPSI